MASPTDTARLQDLERWLEPPDNRSAFAGIERLLACEPVRAGGSEVRELTPAKRELDTGRWTVDLGPGAGVSTLREFLLDTFTDSIIVLHGEEVVLEHYFGVNAPTTRHIAMSLSKSFCGMLAGALLADGALEEAAPAQTYVPELSGGSFADATVRQLLDMTAAPRFDMSYTDPAATVQTGDRCAGWRPARDGDPAGTRDFLASLTGHARHGAAFQYCSASTDVLSWILERATGIAYRELLGDRIWSRIGAEADALITVDRQGTPYACAGMSMRLRDLARFGRLLLDGGVYRGNVVVPRAWVEQTWQGGEHSTLNGIDRVPGTYRNQCWVPSAPQDAIYGAGIFGQYLWLDRSADVVIAKFSSEPTPLAHGSEHVYGLASIVQDVLGREA